MLFPVMQYETKNGIDFRVAASKANIRSGSQLIGFFPEESKRKAIEGLKLILKKSVNKHLYPK